MLQGSPHNHTSTKAQASSKCVLVCAVVPDNHRWQPQVNRRQCAAHLHTMIGLEIML
jgi:hypothetical protein